MGWHFMSDQPSTDFYRSTPINLGMSLLDFYKARLLNQIHYVDLYKGVRILKLPEDLRTYERLIEDSKPEVIVELGIEAGGSSLWFADRLSNILGGGEVIGVDIDTKAARENISYDKRITIIDGDLTAPETIKAVYDAVGGRRAMIIEDAAHTYECTLSAMNNYSELVPVGGWFIVEDGIVDIEELRVYKEAPRGVIPALNDFMETEVGKKFTRLRLAPYGITANPGGWLQREYK
jgi:cephalosporin hydroxylase